MKAGNDPGPVAGAIFYLLVGPIIWACHLFLTYGPQAALCAFRAVDPFFISTLVGVVTALSAAALAVVLLWPVRTSRVFRAGGFLEGENRSFMISAMRLLAGLSLAGVLWAGAVAFILDPCGQLR
ncbi:MAG: hypothetical protein H0T56_18015 [Pseudaminobacter sp.]|nr:hypothetical protein [Pseudaminobacter sp.]